MRYHLDSTNLATFPYELTFIDVGRERLC